MSDQCLIAEYKSMNDAKTGLEILGTDGFTSENVSVVSQHDDKSMSAIANLKSKQTDSPPADSSISVGAIAGGAMATPLAVSTMIGPFMVAGPLAAMAIGATVGGLLSKTDQWGVQHAVASDYEQRVLNDGSILVVVNDNDSIRIDDAQRLLKTSEHRSIQRFTVDNEA